MLPGSTGLKSLVRWQLSLHKADVEAWSHPFPNVQRSSRSATSTRAFRLRNWGWLRGLEIVHLDVLSFGPVSAKHHGDSRQHPKILPTVERARKVTA